MSSFQTASNDISSVTVELVPRYHLTACAALSSLSAASNTAFTFTAAPNLISSDVSAPISFATSITPALSSVFSIILALNAVSLLTTAPNAVSSLPVALNVSFSLAAGSNGITSAVAPAIPSLIEATFATFDSTFFRAHQLSPSSFAFSPLLWTLYFFITSSHLDVALDGNAK
jgi:hypothetical protein